MSNKTDLQALNANYEALIDELRGKAVSGGTDLKTCTLTVSGVSTSHYPTDIAYTTIDDSGNVQYAYDSVSGSSITVTCLRNSIVAVKFKSTLQSPIILPSMLFYNETLGIFRIGDTETETITNSRSFS